MNIKKIILRSLATLGFLLIAVIVTAVIIVSRYQDEAKAFVVDKVKGQLNTELILDPANIDFTVLSTFPYASVNIKKIALLDAVAAETKDKDTLLKAGLISFRFSIRELMRKHYVLESVHLKDANLNVWVNKEGKDNFHFWKANADSSESANNGSLKDTTTFGLNKLSFENIQLHYTNHATKDEDAVTIRKMELKGKFNSDDYTLKTKLEVYVTKFCSKGTVLMQHRNIQLNTALEVTGGTRYAIQYADLNLEKLAVEIKGTFDNLPDTKIINMSLDGKNMDIQSALSWLPGSFRKDIAEFESKGKFFFHVNISGNLDKKHSPLIVASAGVTKGEIRQTKSNIDMKNIDLQLEYTSAGTGKVRLTHFMGELPAGKIKAELAMENFNEPQLDAELEGNANLNELQKFLRIDTIEKIDGQLDFNVHFHGPLKKTEEAFLKEDQASGDVHFQHLSLKLRNNNLKFEDINGGFHLGRYDVDVNGFKGVISGNDFEVNGTMKNLLAWAGLKDEPLQVNLNLVSKQMDLNVFLSDKTAPASKDNPTYKFQVSPLLDLTLNSKVGHLAFRKFDAKNITGNFVLKNKIITIDPLSFSTMNGTIASSIKVDASRNDSVQVTYQASLNNIDVSQIFTSFENFGQETMTDKNVKGNLTGTLAADIPCGTDLSVNTAKVDATFDATLTDGQLINFGPIKSMSKFISMKELEDIKFAKMSSVISIHNRLITIPQTEINSSIMDMEVSGSQDFDENVDYVFGVYLSELLTIKAKERKKENSDFGEMDDVSNHRFRIYINMKGPMDNAKFSYDKKAARAERKANRKAEKEKIKGLLNKRLGWYKSDSLAVKLGSSGNGKPKS